MQSPEGVGMTGNTEEQASQKLKKSVQQSRKTWIQKLHIRKFHTSWQSTIVQNYDYNKWFCQQQVGMTTMTTKPVGCCYS